MSFTAFASLAAEPSISAELAGLLVNLPVELRTELLDDGAVSRYYSGVENPELIPEGSLRREIMSDLQSIDVNVGVESLYLYPTSEINNEREIVFSKFLRISELEGIEYYSASREKMWPLFEQSYVIDDPSSMTRIPDPVVSTVPVEGTTFIFQEDTTFGKNISRLDYTAVENTIHMTIVNISPYKYGIVRIIRPGNMHLHVVLYRFEDYLLYYGTFGARSGNYFLFEKRIHRSFLNRLDALYNWYIEGLTE